MIQQINSDKGRYYLRNGVKLPSVTSITRLHSRDNKFLQEWLSNPENVQASQDAALFGRCVHNHLESYFKGFDDDTGYQFFYDAFNEFSWNKPHWCKEEIDPNYRQSKAFFDKVFLAECEVIKPFVIAVEQSFYSETFLCAGTVDLVLKVFNPDLLRYELTVIDFKTSGKKKSPNHLLTYRMQLAAYSVMVKEQFDLPVSHARLLIGVVGTQMLQMVEVDTLDLKMALRSFAEYRDIYLKENGF